MKAAAAAPRWSPAAPPWPWSGWPRSRRPHRSSSPGGSGRLRPWTASCAGSVVHARIGAFVVRVAVGPSRRPFPSTGEVLDAHQRMLGGPEPDAAHVVEVAPPVEPERERHASGQGRPAVHHQPSMPSISANAGMRRLRTTQSKTASVSSALAPGEIRAVIGIPIRQARVAMGPPVSDHRLRKLNGAG
jgi:hypothetical protein